MAKKNKKPEKLVEEDIIKWYERNGWFMRIFDSKATFSQYAQTYKKSKSVPEGFPDSAGFTKSLIPAYVEFKAPGRRLKASEEQLALLCEVICLGAFGCVTDRAGHLEELYTEWLRLGRDPVLLLLDLGNRDIVLESVRMNLAKSNSIDLLQKFEKASSEYQRSPR